LKQRARRRVIKVAETEIKSWSRARASSFLIDVLAHHCEDVASPRLPASGPE
jgi:hypothetical protein